ncbi:hypothetical protein JHK85_030595 [Glycine max]|nr:hypothetical protein JHK85_030595 [Glycine max]KAG4993232.1 hypothetical protein JHK86_030059 [Glycine max]
MSLKTINKMEARPAVLGLHRSLRGDVKLVSKLLLQHHNPTLQLHSITLTPTLLRLKNHSKIALSLFQCAKTLPKPPLSHSYYTLLIDTMAKIRQFDVHGNSSSKWTKATSPQPPLLS